ncbi:ATP-binding protein [Calidifontibacillus erzurumensis]|uniref:histidine kinase n=1 Tax=Calidifontibacillus erzurumensis TaxID=2741433 RepID=A0A8J8GBV0_9BACI|nr:ATP-binding protein [Calidifontibacillus erzurumensis]NSL50654.1 PAS domain-containing protein [Calidifontibacillus erzurumensis]
MKQIENDLVREVREDILENNELRRQLEMLNEVLRSSNERHFELLESISDGFCAVNRSWAFTFLNNSLENIFKKSRDELLGKSLWSVFPIDSHPGIYKNICKAMGEQKVVRFQEYTPKFNKYLQFTAYPSKDGLSILTQDVTEQVRMIEALIESEERFHLLANNMGQVFWIASPDFEEWYYISPAIKNILGFSSDEFEEKYYQFLQQIDPCDRQKVHAALLKMRECETIFEFRYQQPNLPPQWIRVKGIPVFKDGILEVIVGITEDITRIIEREELLSRSDKLSTVGQLAAGIAHEIRNPLTSIKGFLQIIKSEGQVPNSYTDIMLDELERIESIINEFLFLAKPQQEIKYEVQYLKPVLEQVIRFMEAEANLKGIEIKVDLWDITSAKVNCNANHIKQIFINIIKNSLEAIQSKGTVVIKGEINKEDSTVTIRVIDDGHGISKERLKKLGEPFYSTKEKGTGLGLMITRKLVEDHLGELHFDSEVGKGTTVSVQLPLTRCT